MYESLNIKNMYFYIHYSLKNISLLRNLFSLILEETKIKYLHTYWLVIIFTLKIYVAFFIYNCAKVKLSGNAFFQLSVLHLSARASS